LLDLGDDLLIRSGAENGEPSWAGNTLGDPQFHTESGAQVTEFSTKRVTLSANLVEIV